MALAVIPARFASSRFPGKPLADRTGKPMIQHVVEQVTQARTIERTIVATDDQRIFDAVTAFGGEAIMTRSDHPNGTTRIAEVADLLPGSPSDIIVNVQGDEPEIEPRIIDALVQSLERQPAPELGGCAMATLAARFGANEDASNPNIVKVVATQTGEALYFSRSLIPFDRDQQKLPDAQPLRHIGMYAYRRAFLLKYVTLPETPLERAERLEQLRALEHGHRIALAVVQSNSHGIDTPQQYEAFVQRQLTRQ